MRIKICDFKICATPKGFYERRFHEAAAFTRPRLSRGGGCGEAAAVARRRLWRAHWRPKPAFTRARAEGGPGGGSPRRSSSSIPRESADRSPVPQAPRLLAPASTESRGLSNGPGRRPGPDRARSKDRRFHGESGSLSFRATPRSAFGPPAGEARGRRPAPPRSETSNRCSERRQTWLRNVNRCSETSNVASGRRPAATGAKRLRSGRGGGGSRRRRSARRRSRRRTRAGPGRPAGPHGALPRRRGGLGERPRCPAAGGSPAGPAAAARVSESAHQARSTGTVGGSAGPRPGRRGAQGVRVGERCRGQPLERSGRKGAACGVALRRSISEFRPGPATSRPGPATSLRQFCPHHEDGAPPPLQ